MVLSCIPGSDAMRVVRGSVEEDVLVNLVGVDAYVAARLLPDHVGDPCELRSSGNASRGVGGEVQR